MATSFGSTVTYHPGVMVTVDDGTGDLWAGQITRTGLWPTSPVLVAVVDPLDHPEVIPGQRIVVSPRSLSRTFRGRWGRAPKPLLGKAHTWCGGI